MLSKKARPLTNSYKDDVLLMNTKYKNDSETMEGLSQKNQQGGNGHDTRVSKSEQLISNNKDVSEKEPKGVVD